MLDDLKLEYKYLRIKNFIEKYKDEDPQFAAVIEPTTLNHLNYYYNPSVNVIDDIKLFKEFFKDSRSNEENLYLFMNYTPLLHDSIEQFKEEFSKTQPFERRAERVHSLRSGTRSDEYKIKIQCLNTIYKLEFARNKFNIFNNRSTKFNFNLLFESNGNILTYKSLVYFHLLNELLEQSDDALTLQKIGQLKEEECRKLLKGEDVLNYYSHTDNLYKLFTKKSIKVPHTFSRTKTLIAFYENLTKEDYSKAMVEETDYTGTTDLLRAEKFFSDINKTKEVYTNDQIKESFLRLASFFIGEIKFKKTDGSIYSLYEYLPRLAREIESKKEKLSITSIFKELDSVKKEIDPISGIVFLFSLVRSSRTISDGVDKYHFALSSFIESNKENFVSLIQFLADITAEESPIVLPTSKELINFDTNLLNLPASLSVSLVSGNNKKTPSKRVSREFFTFVNKL